MKTVGSDYFIEHKQMHSLRRFGDVMLCKSTQLSLEKDRQLTDLYRISTAGLEIVSGPITGDYFMLDENTLVFKAILTAEDEATRESGVPLSVFHTYSLNTQTIEELFRVNLSVISCHIFGQDAYLLIVDENLYDNERMRLANGDIEEFIRLKKRDKGCYVAVELPARRDGRYESNRYRRAMYILENGLLTKLTSEFESVYDFDIEDTKVLYSACTFEDGPREDTQLFLLDLVTKTIREIPQDCHYDIGRVMILDEDHIVVTRTDQQLFGRSQSHFIDKIDISTGATIVRLNENAFHNFTVSVSSMDLAQGEVNRMMRYRAGVILPSVFYDSVRFVYTNFEAGTVDIVTPPIGKVQDYVLDGDILYFLAMIEGVPQELYSVDLRTQELSRLTSINSQAVDDYIIQTYLPITSVSEDGTEVYGFAIEPVGMEAGKKYPTVLFIHGGPHAAYGKHLSHEFLYMSARGYGVIFCNPRGSKGRGSEFKDLRGGMYTVDFTDVVSFTKHCVSELNWIDGERLGVTGFSYGGMLTNRMITHSDLFKAAVSDRSIANELSHAFLGDLGYDSTVNNRGGDAWMDWETLWEKSALKHADKITAPTLIIHGAKDCRCEADQSYQLFAALKRLEVPTRLIIFNDENHSIVKPANRVRRLEEMASWFDKYL